MNLEHRVWRKPILPELLALPTLTRKERRARAVWPLLRRCSRIAQLSWEDQPVTELIVDSWSSARVTQRITDPRLKFPTTAATTQDALTVVNGHLNKVKEPPSLLPFDVLTLT